jgi:hydrogenase/urease accessory protein HupE
MRFLRVFLVFSLLFSSITLADEIRPCYLQIKAIDKNNYDVLFKIPAKHKKLVNTLKLEFDKSVSGIDDKEANLVDGSYIKSWQIVAKDGLADTSLHVAGLSASASEVLLRVIDENGAVSSASISPSDPNYTFEATPDTLDTIKTYTVLGVEHILEGTDHLLFVACLVMIAATFTKLLWTITGFTLAHSITLFLSALNVVHVPITPIEASIALSIVFLASEIARGDKNSITYRYPGLVSSSFGLLHGFGFASALMEIGLPQQERIYALLFFNVGVEIGQLMFVSVLFAIIFVLNRIWKKSTDFKWDKIVAYVIGSIAMMWLIERVLVF